MIDILQLLYEKLLTSHDTYFLPSKPTDKLAQFAANQIQEFHV